MARASRSRSALQAAAFEAIRLACDFRMTPSLQHLQPVGAQGGAGGGDVDDEFGQAGGRRAFRRAQALDDAIAGDAVAARRSGASGSYTWWRRGSGGRARAGRSSDISSRSAMLPHVDPAAGTATTTSARPKPQRLQKARRAASAVGNVLAHEILAGDAEVRACRCSGLRDLGGGDEIDLHVRQLVDLAPVAARRARLAQREPGARQGWRCTAPSAAPSRARQNELARSCAPPPSQHGEQALGVNAGADGGHLRRERRPPPAGRRSGRRRRRGLLGPSCGTSISNTKPV